MVSRRAPLRKVVMSRRRRHSRFPNWMFSSILDFISIDRMVDILIPKDINPDLKKRR